MRPDPPGGAVALGLLILLAACGGCRARDAPFFAAAGLATGGDAPKAAREAAKVIARSVWAVVPDPPRRKRDLRPEMIRGSAVAVSPGTLLATCRVVGGRAVVGIVRHGKYHRARQAGRRDGDVCVLEAPDGVPLEAARGGGTLHDLDPGEPVYALASRDGARLALARVPLTGRRLDGSRLETDLALPPGALSVVLFDGEGRLLGLGVPGALRPAEPRPGPGAAVAGGSGGWP